MFLLSLGNALVDLDSISSIFITEDNRVCAVADRKQIRLGTYANTRQATVAMKTIINGIIAGNNVITVPVFNNQCTDVDIVAPVKKEALRYVVAQDYSCIVNISKLYEFYIKKTNGFQIEFKNGCGCQIDRYDDFKTASLALDMFADALNINEKSVFILPNEKQIQSRVLEIKTDFSHHHATGKKTKGHGGS